MAIMKRRRAGDYVSCREKIEKNNPAHIQTKIRKRYLPG
jgi:hypothetical protein